MVFSRPVLNVCWVIRILWEVGVENADVKKSSLWPLKKKPVPQIPTLML